MTDTPAAAPAAKAAPPVDSAEDIAKAHEAALKEMTDHAVAERVRAFHQHASTSKAATEAMLADYHRLLDETTKAAAASAVQPVKTA